MPEDPNPAAIGTVPGEAAADREPAAVHAPSSESADPPAPGIESSPRWARWAPLGVAAAVPTLLFFFFPPLTTSGLWDPYELNVADLSRRIALNLYGAALSTSALYFAA